jgi:hypothetical protein
MTGADAVAAFLQRIPLALKTQAFRFVGPMQGLLTTRFPMSSNCSGAEGRASQCGDEQ